MKVYDALVTISRVISLSPLLFITMVMVINKMLPMHIVYESKAKPVVINKRPVVNNESKSQYFLILHRLNSRNYEHSVINTTHI